MARRQTRFDLYSRTISNAAVSEFDAEPDPAKRFRKYAYTITNAEQVAIDALIRESEAPPDQPESGDPVTIRLDPDVLAHFRKTGPDWHRRINEALRAWIRQA